MNASSKSQLDSLRRHLLARIHRRYQTLTENLNIGGMEILFTRIAQPDTVLDEVAAEEDRREKTTGQRHEDPLHLPYWAELWESASGIAKYLVESQSIVLSPQSSVLDLGCGQGLSGTVAAALGASVLFADLESPALLFAKLNSLPFSERVRMRRLDWRVDRLDETFDLILGADILYERKQWDYLEPFWRVHLREGGRVLLGEPGRQTGDLFIPWIEVRRWRLRRFDRPLPEKNKIIRLFEISDPR